MWKDLKINSYRYMYYGPEKKFLPDYNPKDERGGNTRFLLAHLSWKKVMWLLCLLLKLIDNFVNKRWGLLGALKRFYSWTFSSLVFIWPLSNYPQIYLYKCCIWTYIWYLIYSGKTTYKQCVGGFFSGTKRYA